MSSVRKNMAAVQKAQNKQFEADKRGFLPLQEPTATLKPFVDEVTPEVAPVAEETTPAPEKPKTAKTAKTKKLAPKGKKS
jgi:hypothetical protein